MVLAFVIVGAAYAAVLLGVGIAAHIAIKRHGRTPDDVEIVTLEELAPELFDQGEKNESSSSY